MTLAAFHAAVSGFLETHGASKDEATEDEFIAVLAEEIAAGRA